jgi:hypothetical protein
MTIRKPSDDDLYEIANYLDEVHPDSVVYPAAKVVARWLMQSATGDRAVARKLGCTVAYYRKYMKPGAEAAS